MEIAASAVETHQVVGTGVPEFRRESHGQAVRRRPEHLVVHLGELSNRQEITVGQRDVGISLEWIFAFGEAKVGVAVVCGEFLEAPVGDVDFVGIDVFGSEMSSFLEFAGLEVFQSRFVPVRAIVGGVGERLEADCRLLVIRELFTQTLVL